MEVGLAQLLNIFSFEIPIIDYMVNRNKKNAPNAYWLLWQGFGREGLISACVSDVQE